MGEPAIRVVITDVGGVLATNGWDTGVRNRMVEAFSIDKTEVDRRHHLMFDSYERGNLTLEDYLQWVVFHQPRPFSLDDVRNWMFEQGKALPGTYDVYQRVRAKNPIRLGIISNEGGGLVQDRVRRFRLRELTDFMIFSSDVGMRKPDPEIWRLALMLAQVKADECIYIDDRELFVQFAASLGFHAYQHTASEKTAAHLTAMGLSV